MQMVEIGTQEEESPAIVIPIQEPVPGRAPKELPREPVAPKEPAKIPVPA